MNYSQHCYEGFSTDKGGKVSNNKRGFDRMEY